jgi:TonB-linked SusC/RagA family outer membrane protein
VDHQISAIAGYTIQQTEGEVVTANSYGFVNDINKYNALQDGTAGKPTSDAYKSVLKSYLGRVNYSLLQRYHLTLSARADGSSRFGSASRWGFFPSAGFSWNITDEAFAKNIPGVSDIKLRLSTGTTGNQEIADYLSLASLGSTNYNLGGTNLTGFSPTRLSNPDLKWEKTTQSNIGLDVSLFDKRVNLVIDAYYKKTTDLLVNVPVPLSSGYTSVLQNIGAVENKGLEFAISTDNVRGDDFTWKTNANIAFNRNQVLEIGNGVQQFFPTVPSGVLSLQQPVIVKVGYPLGTFWGYQTDGLYQSTAEIASQPTLNGVAATKPGDRRYKDISGPAGVPDGKISAAYDKVDLGSAQPLFTAALSNTFTYQGFDLSFSFQGVYGNKVFNALRQQLEIPSLAANVTGELANYWTPSNTNTDIPRAANSPAAVVSDRTIEDGSFVRLKTLTLGYTIPKAISEKAKLSNVKVYVSGSNLLTWTKYSGFDPEISNYEQSNLYPGIDYGAYPNARTITAGLNISF